MHDILDRVRSGQNGSFRPKTSLEYFALRLAQKLSDAPQVCHYIALVERHGEDAVVSAYRKARQANHQTMPLSARFHEELGYREEGGPWSNSE